MSIGLVNAYNGNNKITFQTCCRSIVKEIKCDTYQFKSLEHYYDCIHEINVPKKYIVERDYLSIWHGICSIIRNSVTNVCDTECLSGNHWWNLSSDMTNVAAKVIDKLYEIDWE